MLLFVYNKMPQTDFLNNELLVIYGIFFTVLVFIPGSDGAEFNNLDEYFESFLYYAYYADKLCFYLDENLQRFFTIIVHYTLLQKIYFITRQDGQSYCLPQFVNTGTEFFMTQNFNVYLMLAMRDFNRLLLTDFYGD